VAKNEYAVIYSDSTRITATTFNELYRFCERKELALNRIESVDGLVFLHLQAYDKMKVKKSTGVKTVDADEFNSLALRMSKHSLKESVKAYHDIQEEKKGKYLVQENNAPERLKNGKKYKLAGKFKATGERELLRRLIRERGARSEISGEPLIIDEKHPFWHWQLIHIVPKSIAEEFRLREDNVLLGSCSEHDTQTRNPSKTKLDPRWNKFWERYDKLRIEYEQSFRKFKIKL